ncbi:MAG: DUF1588 domain-containing protein, partial [Myxococcaceae bacterium]|nr:DUF1588 domain-containing protein [Myxococcaceae bacterium]
PEGSPAAIERTALASRLSYLFWSSAPDDALLEAELDDPSALTAQVDRLLDDPRGERFVTRFLGQWLGTIRLESHAVDTTLFPQWSPAVASGVEAQANAFFAGFVRSGARWADLFSAPHPAEPAVAPLLSADPAGPRTGFLTLPAYLTLTSHSDRTSPTARAKVIVASLFCTDMSPPPGIVAELEPAEPGAEPKTVRERLEAHRRNPACASCHNVLDPLGLSLERYDAVGRYRSTEAGQTIDTSSVYLGTPIAGVEELSPLLARDGRLASCATKKLLGFALRRSLTQDDRPRVDALVEQWGGGTIRQLAHDVVQTPAFRGLTEERSP